MTTIIKPTFKPISLLSILVMLLGIVMFFVYIPTSKDVLGAIGLLVIFCGLVSYIINEIRIQRRYKKKNK